MTTIGRDSGASLAREGIRRVNVTLDSFNEAQALKENRQSMDGISEDLKRGVDAFDVVSVGMGISRYNDNRGGDEDPRIGVLSYGDPNALKEGPMHSYKKSNGKTLYNKELGSNVKLEYDLHTGKYKKYDTNNVQFNSYNPDDKPSPSNTSEVHQRYFVDSSGRSHYSYEESHPGSSDAAPHSWIGESLPGNPDIPSVINQKTEVIVDQKKGTVAIIMDDSSKPIGL